MLNDLIMSRNRFPLTSKLTSPQKSVLLDVSSSIDLVHDDVTRPKGSMVVVVTLKSKMAAGSTSSEGNSTSTGSMIHLKAQTNRPSR